MSETLHSMKFYLSADFQLLQSIFQDFEKYSWCTNDNWYNSHLHVPLFFFSSLTRSKCLFIFLFSFIFTLWSTGTWWQVVFILLINTESGLLVRIWWSIYSLIYQRMLWVSFSRKDSGLCIYHLVVWSNFNLLHNSKEITFPM